MIKSRKCDLTKPLRPGKGRGRRGAGDASPASAEAIAYVLRVLDERIFIATRHLSFIGDSLHLIAHRDAVADPKVQAKGDGFIPLTSHQQLPLPLGDSSKFIPQPTPVSSAGTQGEESCLDDEEANARFDAEAADDEEFFGAQALTFGRSKTER